MSIICPKCDTDNPDTLKFCGECGTQLPSPMDIDVTETLEAPKEELTRGTTFADRYEIIEELGKGGMGKVYRVEDKELKQEIALKLIKPGISADKKTIERFRNELKIARNIRHKNVCGMYDLGEKEGAYFITMEYIRGEDLKNLIRKMGQLSAGQAITIAKQVCDGLSEAHRLGVVHRDLKPQNIMIDTDGDVRIMDFGIARSLEGKGITGAGVMIGTPEYMSPEQVEGKETDQRSDIYSLGVILYEMMTGRVPFEGDTPFTIGMKHKGEMPKNPKELNTQISDDLNRVILRCLEKDKDKRYQSAGEVRSELDRIEKGIPTTEREIPKKKPLTSREITVTFGLKKIMFPILIIIAIIGIGLVLWHPWTHKKAAKSSVDTSSLAVLPFEDLSPKKDQDYFCEGITDELINRLSKIEGLKVPARTSSFLVKSQGLDIKEIGEKLNVENVLEGSIRKAGNMIRITVQLINVTEGIPIWSDKYEGYLEDTFNLQDEISLAIVNNLKLELLGYEDADLTKRYTKNFEAYDLYLQGRYFWNKRTKEGLEKSIECFIRTIEIDPNYALAYSGLADCYLVGTGKILGISAKEGATKAMEAAMKALEIDETLAEAHTSLADVLYSRYWDWNRAEREFRRAIELNPNYATAHMWYAQLLWSLGRHEEAIVQAKCALELDSFSLIVNTALGAAFYFAKRYNQAIEQYEHTLELDPNFIRARYWLGFSYVQKKMFKKAIEEFQKATSLSGNSPENLAALGYAYAVDGIRNEAEKILAQLKDMSEQKYVNSVDVAIIYVGLDKRDQAFEWLDKAYEERGTRLVGIKEDPVFNSLVTDSRFQDLLHRMKLSENEVQK